MNYSALAYWIEMNPSLPRDLFFRSALEVFSFNFKASLPLSLDTAPDVAYVTLGSLVASEPSSGTLSLSTMLSQSNSIRNLQLLYDIPQSSFPDIELCWIDCRSLKHVWDFVSMADSSLKSYATMNWMTVDLEAIKSEFQFFCTIGRRFTRKCSALGCG